MPNTGPSAAKEKTLNYSYEKLSDENAKAMGELTEDIRQYMIKFWKRNKIKRSENPSVVISMMSYSCVFNAVMLLKGLPRDHIKELLNYTVDKIFDHEETEKDE